MQNGNFFQPILSTIGLATSFLSTILPIFSTKVLENIVYDYNFIVLTSILTFIFGIIIFWFNMQNSINIFWNLGKLKDRGGGFLKYFFTVNNKSFIWILVTIDILLFYAFLILKDYYILQSFMYLSFFSVLIFIFSFLFSQTKRQFEYAEERDNQYERILKILERNGLIKPTIEIIENRGLTKEEREKYNLGGDFLANKYVKVKTLKQDRQELEVILSFDNKEIKKLIDRKYDRDKDVPKEISLDNLSNEELIELIQQLLKDNK